MLRTIKQQARIAGVLYFLVGITAPIALLYVPGKIIVSGDATATANNIRASESLFRIGIAAELTYLVTIIFVTLALYRLFKEVSHARARELVILGSLISVPIGFLNALNQVAALVVATGPDFLSAYDAPQLDALAYLFLRLHAWGLDLASVFWGLWLFPFGILAVKSGFIPRVFGYLLFAAGFAYVASAYTAVLLPQYVGQVGEVAMILYFGEIPIMLWLLIWGAKGPRANEALS